MLNAGTSYEACGPNVEQILVRGTRIIRGKIPASVRAELRQGVKLGQIGRLARKGLLPEVYYNPAHKYGAIDLQKKEAIYSMNCIARVVVSGNDLLEEAFKEATK